MDGQQQYADAMRAFDTYYTKRAEIGRAWPSKQYRGHRCWGVFMELAKRCHAMGVDVEEFVNCVLAHKDTEKKFAEIVPRDLLSDKAVKVWGDQHKLPAGPSAADKWAQHVRTALQIQRDVGRSDEEILNSAFYTQFPAWFRVLYPEKVDAAVVDKWGEAALQELKADRDVVRFARAAMPDKLAELEDMMGVVDGI